MNDRVAFGRSAEREAAEFLGNLGYTLITRRFKAKHGEIDLIYLDQETLVFVEVRSSRSSDRRPEDGVGERKLNNLCRAAAEFIALAEDRREIRFDLIAIDSQGLRHHKDILGHRL
jgi:putative endonuclease